MSNETVDEIRRFHPSNQRHFDLLPSDLGDSWHEGRLSNTEDSFGERYLFKTRSDSSTISGGGLFSFSSKSAISEKFEDDNLTLNSRKVSEYLPGKCIPFPVLASTHCNAPVICPGHFRF